MLTIDIQTDRKTNNNWWHMHGLAFCKTLFYFIFSY